MSSTYTLFDFNNRSISRIQSLLKLYKIVFMLQFLFEIFSYLKIAPRTSVLPLLSIYFFSCVNYSQYLF